MPTSNRKPPRKTKRKSSPAAKRSTKPASKAQPPVATKKPVTLKTSNVAVSKQDKVLDMLRAPIFEEKVVDLIFKDATITDKEVSIEELTKEEDEVELKGKKKGDKKSAAKKPKKDE